jgi:hypothetical protein
MKDENYLGRYTSLFCKLIYRKINLSYKRVIYISIIPVIVFKSMTIIFILLISFLTLTSVTNSVALSTDNSTKLGNQANLLRLFGTNIEPRDGISSSNETILSENKTNDSIVSSSIYRNFLSLEDKIVRGYFSVGDWEQSVHVSSSSDFQTCIWARNVEVFHGGIQIITPASQFQGGGSAGHPIDGLVLDVPAQTGMDLGCIGADAGETLTISNAFGARVTVFITVITAPSATVNMIGVPHP